MTQFALTLASGSNPVDHVVNVAGRTGDLFGLHDVWVWSAHVGTLLLAGLLTILVLMFAASRIATGPASLGTRRFLAGNPLASMIEVICVYLRENTVRPLLGSRTDRFMPFLWTMFFFILINNLLGLLPIGDIMHVADKATGQHGAFSGFIGATATQNIFVTAALAIIAALVINIAGIRELGVGGYLGHLTAGTKFPISLLLVPIEIIGTIVKPVALALRLFANMTAGHILVAVLFMFAVMGLKALVGEHVISTAGVDKIAYDPSLGGVILGGLITLVSAIAAVAIYFLELFVAFLQAFVFMFLTTVFISQLSHHGEHEHHEGHDHEHAHA
ncbi:MAG: F0F1 ATP synthase subunit A [Phycisphaerales bacterium]